MKLTKKIICCLTILALLIALICFAVYMKSVSDYKQSVKNITFEEIDIANIVNGTYIGECNVNFIYAKVEVTIQNKKITNIEILHHKNDQGKPAEAVIDKIVDEQKISVDAIAGATNSSTVLKKAVENALTQHKSQH